MPRGKSSLSLLIRLSLTAVAIGFVIWKISGERVSLGQIFQVPDARVTFGILSALLLLPFNLGLEALKWKMLVKPFYPEVQTGTAVKAVLAGMASGFFTPNRLGEYAGRVLCLPEGHRVEALVVTFLDRIAQMFVTLVMGTAALLVLLGSLREEMESAIFGSNGWLIIFVAISALSLLIFLLLLAAPQKTIGWVLGKMKWEWARRAGEALSAVSNRMMAGLLLLSLARYMVFTAQYFLLLCGFCYMGSEAEAFGMIALVFLGKSILPSLGFAELGVRESVAIQVMGLYGLSALQAFNSTFLLYLVNILLPSAAGALLLPGLKIDRGGQS